MAHGHFRHSRISKIISARRRLEAELDEQHASDLLEKDDPFQNPILTTDILPTENCDSKNSICLEHDMNESDALLEKRDVTTSADPNVIETVLQIVDASSQTLFKSTATDFSMTISDSTGAIYTLPSSDSLAAGATATASASISIDLGLLTSTTPASATQPTASPLSETSFSSISAKATQPSLTVSTNSTQTSLTISTNSTQTSLTSTNPTSQFPSALRSSSATVINSSAWTSTRLGASSTSILSVVTTTPQAHNYWSSSTTPTSSTDYTTSSSDVYGGSGPTDSATGTGAAPTTSETQASGPGSTNNPATPKIVGGVVGSVAGIALIFLLLFYFLRRRGFLMGKIGRPTMLGDAAAGAGAGTGSREMSQRRESNDPLFTASYLAPAFMKRWRQSTATTRSGSTIDSVPSERGFQKISGRKLPPVYTHGGDGYGGGIDGESPTVPASGPIGSTSFYAPPPSSQYGMPLDSNYTREVEEHTPPTRPNVVHLPISSSVNVSTPVTVTPAHPVAQPQSAIPFAPPRPDGLGRSLHSFDGSRSSRFTEVIE
ncbi:uncharacterized protein N7479_007587 [Penicillium vulpinum]|uniref:uncharacterized protein n=1 Tax=Penicillium vulpinum TaxID=29845 RepID=UPI0025498A3B|nr:uncharacterized protein N7479_007587 [Penicillium vulpinum]KAJ5960437.1 hypothetical protein N7479_007587 [Penicillium vulpinum]